MVDGAFIKFGVLGGHVFTEVGLESIQRASFVEGRVLTRECVEVGVQSHHMKQELLEWLSYHSRFGLLLCSLLYPKSQPLVHLSRLLTHRAVLFY